MTISPSEHVQYSALLADRHCGDESELIFYLEPGNLLSRAFTSRDTHTLGGDLLVMYTEARRASPGESRFAKASGAVLDLGGGPSFTSGTDVVLPVSANTDLRATLTDEESSYNGGGEESPCDDAALIERLSRFPDVYVPQVCAIRSVFAACAFIVIVVSGLAGSYGRLRTVEIDPLVALRNTSTRVGRTIRANDHTAIN